ncbi:ribonuclease H-like domain-containing protein, partial [Tanacetum coccineum]
KKNFINANDSAGYDKSKVECFNCHKMGHFAMECRAPRTKEGQFRYQDNTRKQGNNEDTSSKAMLSIDGVAATYKRGLATVEEQLVTYRKNEDLFSKEVAVLKREVASKDYEINMLKNKLLGSQITEKSKKGLRYNVVPPPQPLIYNRPNKLDLSYSGLDEFKDPEFKSYGSKDSKLESNINKYQKTQAPLNVDKEIVLLVDKKIKFIKPKNHEKPVKKSVRYDNTAMRYYHTERPRAVNIARSYTAPVNVVRAKRVNAVKTSACWGWRPTRPNSASLGKPQQDYTGFINSGCSRHMNGNIAYLSDFKEFDRGYVTFGGGAHGGRISSKETLKTNSLNFKDVYFVNELNFNHFSVSQMCDKKNHVLFTDTECLVLSPNFKLPNESHILLKIPRKNNMYSFDMKNIVSKESLTCLVAKATLDESMLWH